MTATPKAPTEEKGATHRRRNRFLTIGVLGAAMALILSGCVTVEPAPSGGGDTNDNTGIVITGTGEVAATPDVAYLRYAIETRAARVGDARQANAEAAETALAAVKDLGVEADDISTVEYSIRPEYNWERRDSNGRERIVGYVVTNGIRLTIRDIDTTSEIIDAIGEVGDDVRISDISFGIDDRDALTEEARQQAVADAEARAEQLAEAAGATLGEVISISETSIGWPQPVDYRYMDALAGAEEDLGASTPIEPGSQKVHASVTIRWALGD